MESARYQELRNALETDLVQIAEEDGKDRLFQCEWVVEQLENYCRRWFRLTKNYSKKDRFKNDLWYMTEAGLDVTHELLKTVPETQQTNTVNLIRQFRKELEQDGDSLSVERIEEVFKTIQSSIRS